MRSWKSEGDNLLVVDLWTNPFAACGWILRGLQARGGVPTLGAEHISRILEL